jgi:hypothetical protein
VSNMHPLTFGVSVGQVGGETGERALVAENARNGEVKAGELAPMDRANAERANAERANAERAKVEWAKAERAKAERAKVELGSGGLATGDVGHVGLSDVDLGGVPAGGKRREGVLGLALDLFAFASGRPSADEEASEAVRLRRAGQATLASLGLAALWGLAAASTEPALAVANLLKMPMVVMLSLGAALPAGVVAWRLSDTPGRASDLLVSGAAANLAATLVMAATAPLVALYHHSSASFGAGLAMGSAGLGVLLGLLTLKRGIRLRAPEQSLSGRRLPSFILAICWIGALVQFIHVASPIIPEVTVFDGGVDAILGR